MAMGARSAASGHGVLRLRSAGASLRSGWQSGNGGWACWRPVDRGLKSELMMSEFW